MTMGADINTARQSEAVTASLRARAQAVVDSRWTVALVFGAVLLVMFLSLTGHHRASDVVIAQSSTVPVTTAIPLPP